MSAALARPDCSSSMDLRAHLSATSAIRVSIFASSSDLPYVGTDTPATFRTWSILETIISVVGLVVIFVLSHVF